MNEILADMGIGRTIGWVMMGGGLLVSLFALGIPFAQAMFSVASIKIYTKLALLGLGLITFGLIMACDVSFLKDENNVSLKDMFFALLGCAVTVWAYFLIGDAMEWMGYANFDRGDRFHDLWTYRGNQ